MLRCIVSPTLALVLGGVYKNGRKQRRPSHPYQGLMYPRNVENRINNPRKNKNNNNNNNKNNKNKQNKNKQNKDRLLGIVAKVSGLTSKLNNMSVGKKVQSSNVSAYTGLSVCAAKYAKAICDPWSAEAASACIPRFPARPSQKVTGFTRFTATLGTNGFGFVVLAPCLANDRVVAWYSNSSYAGGSLTPAFTTNGTGVTSTAGVQTHTMGNLPYTASDILSNDTGSRNLLTGRMVSFGASIQYIGTMLNQSGTYHMYTDPGHNNLFLTNNLNDRSETIVRRVDNNKQWITVSAVNSTELEYTSSQFINTGGSPYNAAGHELTSFYPFSNGDYLDSLSAGNGWINASSPSMILFSGVPGEKFHVELITHVEFVGTAAESKSTPSHADAQGTEQVISASANANKKMAQDPERTWTSAMGESLGEVLHALKPVVKVAAMRYMRRNRGISALSDL